MTFSDKFKFAIAAISLMLAGAASAQDDRNDEADVWSTIEDQWEAEERGDKDWLDRLLVDEFSGTPIKIVDKNVGPLQRRSGQDY